MFERTEQSFFRKILAAHSKTPVECLYLELGIIPLRFHLMSRRLMYLHSIMQRDNNELVKKVIESQKITKRKGDFYTQTLEDMKCLEIDSELLNVCRPEFKKMVEQGIKTKAFQYLIEKARSHTKVRESCYKDINGSSHYMDSRFTPDLVEILFKFRTRTYAVKNNFRNNYINTNLTCPLCQQQQDDQQHIFECITIRQQHNKTIIHSHDDIYSEDTDTLLSVAREIQQLVKLRELLLKL